jgi:hypothetical protein
MSPEDTPIEPDAREEALVDLVRCDYDATLRALGGFVASGNQLRAIGLAAWGVVIGLAVRDDSPPLALLAILLLALFALADAYHAALYRRAMARAIELEDLLDRWGDRLGIDADDPERVADTRSRLEVHRFGAQKSLKRPDWGDMARARPWPVFRIIYPALLVVSIVTVIAYACD